MREFYHDLAHALKDGNAAILVSILTSGGSTPRGAGAMMAVFPDGGSIGTIGGGNAEYEAQKEAARLLVTRQSGIRAFRFVQGDASSAGMVCGGDVTVHFQYLEPGDRQMIAVCRDLLWADGRNADTWFVRRLDGSQVTVMGVADRKETRLCAQRVPDAILQNRTVLADGWFSIPVVKAGRVYLFGGGHVSQALVPVIARTGFRPVVLDDRAEFSSPALFPDAEQTMLCDFNALSDIRITPDDYVVIMTRGHQADYEVLTQVLRCGAKYIGCIGSAKKLALCRDRLLAAGFTAEEYDVLHAPIGLAIGAQTPEEIAISVAAELIAVRAGVRV